MEKVKIEFELTLEEVQSFQNGLGYASWQFKEGGDSDCKKDAKVLDKIHDQIKKETGKESVH